MLRGYVRTLLLTILLLALPTSVQGRNTAASETLASPIPVSSRQLLLVRASSWWATTGTLQRYERDSGSSWRSVGAGVPVNLGRSGMGWGRGLHASAAVGPQKREGDGRSPAGVFRLSRAFGAAEALPPESRGFPYAQSLPTTY